jgi:hypothetical protein
MIPNHVLPCLHYLGQDGERRKDSIYICDTLWRSFCATRDAQLPDICSVVYTHTHTQGTECSAAQTAPFRLWDIILPGHSIARSIQEQDMPGFILLQATRLQAILSTSWGPEWR